MCSFVCAEVESKGLDAEEPLSCLEVFQNMGHTSVSAIQGLCDMASAFLPELSYHHDLSIQKGVFRIRKLICLKSVMTATSVFGIIGNEFLLCGNAEGPFVVYGEKQG